MDKSKLNEILKALDVEHYDGKATVKANGKTETIYAKLVDSEGDEVDPEAEFLTRQLVIACAFVSNNPSLTRGLKEDEVNRLIRDQLKSLLTNKQGYAIPDQSQQGLSESGKEAGEVDFILNP